MVRRPGRGGGTGLLLLPPAPLRPLPPLTARFIKVGDKEVEYHPQFRLILHTKSFNPHYKPEMQAQCTLINFLVTRDGLEDQLLAAVVAKERPDLEQLKVRGLTSQGAGRAARVAARSPDAAAATPTRLPGRAPTCPTGRILCDRGSRSSCPRPPKPNSKSNSRFSDGRRVSAVPRRPDAPNRSPTGKVFAAGPVRGGRHTRVQSGPHAPLRLVVPLPSQLGPWLSPPPSALSLPQANLTKSQNEFKIVLKELEDSLLARLSAASGNFLGDTALVENLETTKHTASEIEEKVRDRLPGLPRTPRQSAQQAYHRPDSHWEEKPPGHACHQGPARRRPGGGSLAQGWAHRSPALSTHWSHSGAVCFKVKEAKITEVKINEARENYRPAAERASLLYFILNDLNKINPIYQFSLKVRPGPRPREDARGPGRRRRWEGKPGAASGAPDPHPPQKQSRAPAGGVGRPRSPAPQASGRPLPRPSTWCSRRPSRRPPPPRTSGSE